MGNVQQISDIDNVRGTSLTGIIGIGRQHTHYGTAFTVSGCWAGRRGDYDVVPTDPKILDKLNFNDYVEVVNAVVVGVDPRITLRGKVLRLRPYGVKQP